VSNDTGPFSPERRASRLVRAYPPHWRARYGAELADLLADDIARRPRSLRRGVDVAVNAGVARLRCAGLVGPEPFGEAQARSGLATVLVAVSFFLLFGFSMLTQIIVGWRWEPPSGLSITIALILMAASTAVLSALAGAALLPVLWTIVRQVASGQASAIRRPLVVAAAGAAVIVVGARHFEVGWPGSGGHPWAYHAVLPAGPASFVWAATLSVTSYWVHPSALRSFPPIELAWMAFSPPALLGTVVGSVKVVRRIDLADNVLRYESRLADAAVVMTGVFSAGAICWVTGRDPSVHGGLYQVGVVDVVELFVMLAAVALGLRATHRTRSALRLI
jgi:hypothetical protein